MRSRSYIATPPGATIKEQLLDRGMTQKEFAARMDMSEKHISKLINGDVQLTTDMAVRLEIVLGVPARFWNNLEAIYRERIALAQAENAMDEDAVLAGQLPYAEMANNGWVPQTRNKTDKVINLRKYFEVVNLSLLGNQQITRIACRRLEVTDKGDLALMAWAQEARILARGIITARIDVKALQSRLPEIRALTTLSPDEFCPPLKGMLSECGIALIFLPHLRGSYLQGATFEDGNKIVVGMTTRGRYVDRFWFSLFHELAHIILGHIDQRDGTSAEDEHSADAWAADQLIPPQDLSRFLSNGDYSETSIRMFAERINIAPGIVVGRLQSSGQLGHNQLNGLKEQYVIEA